MRLIQEGFLFSLLASTGLSLRYDPAEVDYNLNTNQAAINPLDYSGEWEGHTFFPSPANWRFPFYTFFLDRFVNGDPTNDDANGTVYEHDTNNNQYRHGGDLKGLVDTLDYLQGMGIKGLYIAGTPFINMPWKADAYSPHDLTLLDRHFGTIQDWRDMIEEVHKRKMYVVLDNTMSTLGNLIGFEGFLNESAPFRLEEHKVLYKSDRVYPDFGFGENKYNETCQYPRFWDESGTRVNETDERFAQLKGCYDGDFDQYGDTEAFGVFPDWQRQLSKFASVQDRLREWVPHVNAKIMHFSCMVISQLDIDGFRFDKATQVTVDAQADFGEYMRKCALKYKKDNFFMPGEITGGNTFGSIYLGRGREPQQVNKQINETLLYDGSEKDVFLREEGKNALDAAAFHYSIYRNLVRFLGMDGNLTAGFDVPIDFVDTWNTILTTNDLINPTTKKFDPRHMYGVTNQDVFRWPGIRQGTEKMLLGLFITTLHMPGIPKLLWGEEQAFYILDSTAANYIFGRQPFSATPGWQNHGCYALGSEQYHEMPFTKVLDGCNDDSVSLDHRDPSHPIHNIIKSMYWLRTQFPVLNDGFFLQSLSKQTRQQVLPGSNGTPTIFGMWSVFRHRFRDVQTDLGNVTAIWLVYTNEDTEKTYEFDCNSKDPEKTLYAPYPDGTVVRNLVAPFETLKLGKGADKLLIDDEEINGCLPKLTLRPFDYKVFVPLKDWLQMPPMISLFVPGHDARIVSAGETTDVDLELHFTVEMECASVTKSITIKSTTIGGTAPKIEGVTCTKVPPENTFFVGEIPGVWTWKAKLVGAADGIHEITLKEPNVEPIEANKGPKTTGSTDHFLIRIGKDDNPMVFPRSANYTRDIVFKTGSAVSVKHKAAGADKWRYSRNWASTWSDWLDYDNGKEFTLKDQPWKGTKKQGWKGEHVILQYWSKLAGSSSTLQHADLDTKQIPRRFPHLFAQGKYNMFGFDGGLNNAFSLSKEGTWKFHHMTEWPSTLQVNVWGQNPDGKADASFIYGDLDNNSVLDRALPDALGPVIINITEFPPYPFVAYRMEVEESTMRYKLVPTGNRYQQILMFALLWTLPIATGILSVWTYMGVFYSIKFNKIGVSTKIKIPFAFFGRKKFQKINENDDDEYRGSGLPTTNIPLSPMLSPALAGAAAGGDRRTILVATMEYDIEDWGIKIKIGGLGVMAQLMGKSLTHQDLIWVVPCVGGIEYPIDEPAESMDITVLGTSYEIMVQYHKLRNITYVLLDAPIFRGQSKTEPYPPRMDDLDSAVYYSAWNACIAEAIKRFPVDLYHINDYHGAAAPLYLLPGTIPCALSLHNAEFQGLWPMRTPKEREEVCNVFNLDAEVVEKYIQFGEVFNLLHAAASYLRVHQKGFGAVGVSNKYGERSYARYPIFWGLKKIGKLPNPDPTDTDPWDPEEEARQVIKVDPVSEAARGALRVEAQKWAGLTEDPTAELFVFVGRWSTQKGIDLIADVFPAVLEKHPKVQLICVGPCIDLYGKFAALKLTAIMKKYPGRVFSKPEFTTLPPFIFTGAEFALIPSRDEPFGLVAVEFGRKGALGVGARVGGLGQMPGWWFTVESTTTGHLHRQFKKSIEEALSSKLEVRAMMRARSAKQRFPVAKWVADLNTIQSEAIRIHQDENGSGGPRKRRLSSMTHLRPLSSSSRNPSQDRLSMYEGDRRSISDDSVNEVRPQDTAHTGGGLNRTLSLGVRNGPGHRSRFDESFNEPMTGINEDENRYMDAPGEYTITREQAEANLRAERDDAFRQLSGQNNRDSLLPAGDISVAKTRGHAAGSPDRGRLGAATDSLHPARRSLTPSGLRSSSVLNLNDVKGNREDYSLQKVDPTFEDKNEKYYHAFEGMLDNVSGKNSEGELCIEEYLITSEKEWVARMRDARLGRGDRRPSINPTGNRTSSYLGSVFDRRMSQDSSFHGSVMAEDDTVEDEFLLGKNFKRVSFLKRILLTRVADWPIYSILLGIGQIIAANSYQITLLTGGKAFSNEKLYIVGAVYIITSCLWWLMFRSLKSVYVLSVPFLFYGGAFLIVGISAFMGDNTGRDWVRNVATGMYVTASSSGVFFFALNFGDEGGAPIKAWVYRACIIQGSQQIFVTALFYWGSTIAAASALDKQDSFSSSPLAAAITIPIAVVLWIIGIVLFTSLPTYYRQSPGKIPDFYKTLLRRRIIGWFFIMVIIQNFFLSAPYGRSWNYLWSSRYAPRWAIVLMVFTFFVGVWLLILLVFAILSKKHSWILPIFAIGLGAPRWAQMLWGTSNYGLWLPWMPVGGPVGGALAGRALWLWLGLLDSIQGVGFGMMLLQTLTRIHIAVSLVLAQIIGTAVTMLAKGVANNKDGPADVFPDFSEGAMNAITKPWFWIGLGFQLIIPIGFFKFFRKEQLSKP